MSGAALRRFLGLALAAAITGACNSKGGTGRGGSSPCPAGDHTSSCGSAGGVGGGGIPGSGGPGGAAGTSAGGSTDGGVLDGPVDQAVPAKCQGAPALGGLPLPETGRYPSALAMSDLDGDGKLDLVPANPASNT